MPGEHEVPELDGTDDPQRALQRRSRPVGWLSRLRVSLRGGAEPWRVGKKRVEDALGPASGIAVAVLIAALLWSLIAWIIQQISLLTVTG